MKIYLLGALLAALALPGRAQTLDLSFAASSSLYNTASVYTLGPAQADGKVLAGAIFSRVNNVAVNSSLVGLVRFDATGALDLPFLQNAGLTSMPDRIRLLANGQYMLGSYGSVSAGNITRNSLLRLNADGTADASFTTGNGFQDLTNNGQLNDFVVQPDGKLVAGGYFNIYNGQPVRDVVRLTTSGSLDNTFSTGSGLNNGSNVTSQVRALELQADGKVVVGGNFHSFNGIPASAVVRLTDTGAVDATFTAALGANDDVSSLLVQPDGKIVVTGSLTGPNGHATLLRLLPSGAIDPGFATPAALAISSEPVYLQVAVQPDGKLVVAGTFDLPGYRHLARLNADGSLDVTFLASNGPNNKLYALSLQTDGSIVVGGIFTSAGSAETPLARYSSSGAFDARFAPKLQVEGYINTLTRQADGSVLVAGGFTEWNGIAVHRVMRLSPTGVPDAAYAAAGSTLNGTPTSLLMQADGNLLVAGNGGLTRLLPTGARDPGFAQFVTGVGNVTALAQQADGKLLVAGSLNGTFGSSYTRLVRLTGSGGVDTSFGPPTSSVGAIGAPSALLVQQDGRILLAANPAGGTTANMAYVQRYEPNGTTDASWPVDAYTFTPSVGTTGTARVQVIQQQADGQLLVAGRFTKLGSTAQNHLLRMAPTGSQDASFVAPPLSGGNYGTGITALAIQPSGRVLAGGAVFLRRMLPTGALDASFANTANPNGGLSTIVIQPDGAILLQGDFSAVGGRARLNVARITASDVLAGAAPAAVAERTLAWPVPAHDQLHVQPAASVYPQAAELLDALGRVVRQQALASPAEFTLDVHGLPTGLYVLRLRYQEGIVARTLDID